MVWRQWPRAGAREPSDTPPSGSSTSLNSRRISPKPATEMLANADRWLDRIKFESQEGIEFTDHGCIRFLSRQARSNRS
jgi:hypothetical protein